jgi:peroxiredoxin Q/BCP
LAQARETLPGAELQSDSGETVSLRDLRGKPVVLYFCPKDDAPGS